MDRVNYSFMPHVSRTLFMGGTFQQFNHNHEHLHAQTAVKSGFDHLLEAVAPAAFHNSGERFDPPKCRPNTRTAVIQKIMNWILRSDPETRSAMIMWLSGAAGAGKSAIAQTLAELCWSEGLLLASFFFGRSDPTRNHVGSLVATIIYQLHTLLPSVRPYIIAAIEDDPLIFKRSLSAQFQSLIVKSLRPLFQSGFFERPESPRVIILDGLDECLDRTVQRNIVDVFSKGLRDSGIPLAVLIASRPEHDIKTAFNSPAINGIRADLILDDTYLPDKDIELFLRDSFQECKDNHPFKEYIPSDWPSDSVVEHLVGKSSGQFIYASTVIRYVTSSRHLPHHRLDVVLNIRPSAHDLPFAELDALYKHIFSGVDNVSLVLHVISFTMLQEIWVTVETVEQILRLEPGAVVLLFCDLASVISLQQTTDGLRLSFTHASLSDFLLDPIRSQNLYINLSSERTKHASHCIRVLSLQNVATQDILESIFHFFRINFSNMTVNDQFAEDLTAFSLPDCHSALLHGSPNGSQGLIFDFVVHFLEMLSDPNRNASKNLYTKHLQEYDDFLVTSIASYGDDPRTEFQLALIGLFSNRKLWPMQIHPYFIKPEREEDLLLKDWKSLNLFQSHCVYHSEYNKHLADFLRDGKRSKEYTLGPGLFTRAAIYCMKYLSDHYSKPQMATPRSSLHAKYKRRDKPWMWRRQFPRGIAVGKGTPWMWLRNPSISSAKLDPTRVGHESLWDRVYLHEYSLKDGYRDKFADPADSYTVWSEKYWLYLRCVLYFLPGSKKSDELIHLCQHSTFASRSQDFPRKSRKARRAMVEYLERVGAALY